MILYFTGTGGSRHIARLLGAALGDEAAPINGFIREGRTGAFHSETPYVFVTPTHAWRIPGVVRDFIASGEFRGSRDAYFVMTCGTDAGNAGAYIDKLCRNKGLSFCGLREILMPENYAALFDVPDGETARRIIEAAQPAAESVAQSVASRLPLERKAVSSADRLKSSLVHLLWRTFTLGDRRFRTSASCVGCGSCAALCPVNNISLPDGRPVWNGRCIHCMACIGGCPKAAVEYGRESGGRARFYLE